MTRETFPSVGPDKDGRMLYHHTGFRGRETFTHYYIVRTDDGGEIGTFGATEALDDAFIRELETKHGRGNLTIYFCGGTLDGFEAI